MRRLLAALFLALGLAGPAVAEIEFPIHGNWCGPWHGDGGPAVDALDAACMRHDLCYRRVRFQDCGCDLIFLDEVRRMSWPSEEMYQKGRAIYEAIGLVPCVGTPHQLATKWDWVITDHERAVARGREPARAGVGRMLDLFRQGLANARRNSGGDGTAAGDGTAVGE